MSGIPPLLTKSFSMGVFFPLSNPTQLWVHTHTHSLGTQRRVQVCWGYTAGMEGPRIIGRSKWRSFCFLVSVCSWWTISCFLGKGRGETGEGGWRKMCLWYLWSGDFNFCFEFRTKCWGGKHNGDFADFFYFLFHFQWFCPLPHPPTNPWNCACR